MSSFILRSLGAFTARILKERMIDFNKEAWVHPPAAFGESDDMALPVLMFFACGANEKDLRNFLMEIDRLKEKERFRPLFLIDSYSFHIFRERKLLFEFIPGKEEYIKHFPDMNYDEYFRGRMLGIMKAYRPSAVLSIKDGIALTMTEILSSMS